MKGVIHPECIYTREALSKVAGFGSEKIMKLDTSGIVTPIFVAHRLFYKGKEIIQWMEQQPKRKRLGSD